MGLLVGMYDLRGRQGRETAKVAKRPHATRRLADSQVQVYFWTREKNGCGDGGKTGDAVGRDVGMYVGTLLVGTLVGV